MIGKKTSLLVAVSCGLLCSVASAQRMYGVSWAGGSLYSIDLGTGQATLVAALGVGSLNAAAAVPGADRLYATSTASVLYEIDVNSGTVAATHNLNTSAIPGYTIRGLAVDPNSGEIYAIADTVPFGTDDTLVKINLTTLDYTVIGSMGENSMQGLAFDDGGRLYGLDIDNGGMLFSVNTSTGATAPIGGGGFGPDQQSLEFCDGRMYGGRENLITINTGTGGVGVVGSFGATTDMRGLACIGGSMPCYPDCDGNQVLDVFDFLCFQDAFVAGAQYADCDGNSVFDVFDFLCFQDAFVTGCP
jgi:hypothetical protein